VIKLFIILILFVCDFISKKIIYTSIDLNSFIKILPIIDLTHIHNFGISFGLFSGILNSWIIVFIGIIITLIIIFLTFQTNDIFEKWGFILIISGAISNIFDRTINNYVLDFIYLHYRDFYWPAFNLADIYITLGILIIIYKFVKEIIKKNTK